MPDVNNATEWHRGQLVALDTETTGTDPETDRVVTCSLIHVDAADGVDYPMEWLIDPGVEIPERASAVHGITTEKARAEGQPPAVALADIAEVLTSAIDNGVPLVVFNAVFDLTLLEREFARHGVDCPLGEALVIDGLVIDKAVDRYRKGKRTLTATCEAYRIPLEDAHNASADALAAARLAQALAEKYPRDLQIPLKKLHAKQATWRQEQTDSFAAFLRRQGKSTDDLRGEWPLLPRDA